MKKVFGGVLVIILSLCFALSGYCWTWGKKDTTPAAPAAAPEKGLSEAPAAAASPAAPEAKKVDTSKMRELREKKRDELKNTQWDIDVMALSGKGAKQKDIIIFSDNKFSSEEFAKSGFKESNYTLTVQDNGLVVVETMQTNDKEGSIFWRIEFDSSLASCKGVMSRQLSGNKTDDYSFVSTAKKPFVAKAAVAKGTEK